MISILFLLTCLFLIGMLFNYWLGLIGLIFTIAYVVKKTTNTWEAIFVLLIVALPISYVGILGNLTHHVFSLFNILLIVMICLFWIKNSQNKWARVSVWEVVLVFSFGALYLLHLIQIDNFTIDGIFNFARWYLIILAMYTIYKFPKSLIDQMSIAKLSDTYIAVILATSIALLAQVLLHKLAGLELGNLTLMRLRVSYDVFFLAYSFLAIYLYSGALLSYISFLRTRHMSYGLVTLALLVLSILNSARSGLVVFILVAGAYTLFTKGLSLSKKIVFVFGLLIMFIVCMQLITLVRGNLFNPPVAENSEIVETSEAPNENSPMAQTTKVATSTIEKLVLRIRQFFFDNERMQILLDSLKLWSRDMQTILFGHNNLAEIRILPHNFFVESLLTYGLLLGGWMIVGFLFLIFSNIKSPYFALIIYMLISSQLVTKIHLATWLIPIVFLMRFKRLESINHSDELANSR